MSAPNDGGPAFPLVYVDASKHGVRQTVVADGMSLRDWFAGQALIALFNGEWVSPNSSAEQAYKLADAMLTARLTMPPSTRQTDGGDEV